MESEIGEGGGSEAISEGVVRKKAVSRFGQGLWVVVRHANTRLVDREGRRGSLRCNYRKAAGERIEHLDRQAALGATRDPGEIGGGVCHPTRSVTSQSA
jgi:hypothetical protein